jgi:hypothetical protein
MITLWKKEIIIKLKFSYRETWVKLRLVKSIIIKLERDETDTISWKVIKKSCKKIKYN